MWMDGGWGWGSVWIGRNDIYLFSIHLLFNEVKFPKIRLTLIHVISFCCRFLVRNVLLNRLKGLPYNMVVACHFIFIKWLNYQQYSNTHFTTVVYFTQHFPTSECRFMLSSLVM